MSETNKVKRIEWLDITKGIGIFAVVLGHYLEIFDKELSKSLVPSIFIFHMPLFFFISGFLFKKDDKIISYSFYQFVRLIVPYFSFFILIEISLIVSNKIDFILLDIFRYIWSGRYLGKMTSPDLITLWFLPCLLGTRIVYNFLSVKFSNLKLNIIILACLILAYCNSLIFLFFELPFCIHLILFTIAIFHIGNIYKSYKNNKFQTLLWLLGPVAIYSPHLFTMMPMDILHLKYGTPFITFSLTIVCILFMINLSKLLDRFKIISKILSQLGKASFTIMALHLVICTLFIRDYISNIWITTLPGITLSYIVYKVFDSVKLLRLVFLGEGFSKQKIYQLLRI